MNKQQRREFFARHEVLPIGRVYSWYGLSIAMMTKAELRIVLDNCCLEARKEHERRHITRLSMSVL